MTQSLSDDMPPGFVETAHTVELAEDLGIGIGDDGLITISLRRGERIFATRMDPDAAELVIEKITAAASTILARARRRS